MKIKFFKEHFSLRSTAVVRNLGLLSASLMLFGCPASKQTSSSEDADGTATATSTNTVVIRGSNTIGEELAPRLIAEFKKLHPVVKFDVETKATGYGMAALRKGQCDIAAASRAAIKADIDLANEAGIEMSDYVLGAYSVAVVVNAANPVANLTKDQVRDIFTGKIQNWKEVGGADAPIKLFIRDPISGTHLGFKEMAMDNNAYAEHPTMLTNYEAIVSSVAADPNGIGYSGIHHAKSAQTKAVSIGGVEPTVKAVNDGKYPYARVLRFYTNKAKESSAAKMFIEFVLSAKGQEIVTGMDFTPKP